MDFNALMGLVGDLTPEQKLQFSAALGPPPKPEEGKEKAKATASSGQTPPRISQFSGDSGAKGDVSYTQWRFEVSSLRRDGNYSAALVLQAVRRSIRGTASEVLLNLGEEVTIEDVLKKFELVFGNILPADVILEQFYTARQRDTEAVATWACRLEELVSQLRAKDAGGTTGDAAKSMLRSKFYSGLRCGVLRNSLRHRYDAGATYEELLMAARVAELEEDSEKKKATAKVNQATTVDSQTAKKLDKVLAALEDVQKRLEKLEVDKTQPTASGQPQGQAKGYPRQFNGNCYKCGKFGHPKFKCPLNLQQPASGASGSAAVTEARSQE